ncbi:cysteine desulfurase family protein [Flavobacterium orientale]|uniref:cysteine desulfurase n=1 Tax=Flavobacterium orientale TaxID=1756020 RepID=A0A917DFJ1_9FLAO|nr:cysteine desulfurase family protein [Flavobacterium orientale]GGD32921.1 cysteine desulfurase [Flavobacterium orientale]
MNKIYLDNASTTAIRPEVIQEMTRVMQEDFGNPSSTHSFGRSAKVVLETARKSIAKLLNATTSEIIFTSGATEANNWIISNAVNKLHIKRIISSKVEHHAVLYPILEWQKEDVEVSFLSVDSNGCIDLNELETLLVDEKPTLVSLMHVNNETGVVMNLNTVGALCKKYNALFHSDTVQSIGKQTFNLQETPVDFIVASAHKFNGPKGVGFAYVKKNSRLGAMLLGGEQEKGLRAGTEAIHQIAGMAKALELAYVNLEAESNRIKELKAFAWNELQKVFPLVKSNGNLEETFHSLLNVQLPFSAEKTAMLLFELDMHGIAVSRGSACQSGTTKPSHVLAEMLSMGELQKPSIRISFSYANTNDEVLHMIKVLKEIETK